MRTIILRLLTTVYCLLFMKFTRYSKFKGLDISSLNLGDLMESLSDSLLGSGYDDDYFWTRERRCCRR